MADSTVRALKRNLLNAALALAVVHFVGTLGFYAIDAVRGGDATPFDAFYMTFITVATIGYAETIDLTGSIGGRLFNVAVAVTGIGFLWVMFSNFTALLLARTMDPARSRQRLLKEVAAMQGHFIICGLGRIGSNIAHELHIAAQPFVAIEASQAAVDAFRMHDKRNEDARVLVADASEDDVLLKAGLKSARGVFAATGEDSRNVLIALSARQLNPKIRVVARVHDVRNADKCRRAGADEIVSPDFHGALRMSSAMLQPHAAGFFEELLRRPDAMRLVDVPISAGAAERPLGDLQLRATEYLVVGLRMAGQVDLNPGPETMLEPGMVLIALATPAGLDQLQQRLA